VALKFGARLYNIGIIRFSIVYVLERFENKNQESIKCWTLMYMIARTNMKPMSVQLILNRVAATLLIFLSLTFSGAVYAKSFGEVISEIGVNSDYEKLLNNFSSMDSFQSFSDLDVEDYSVESIEDDGSRGVAVFETSLMGLDGVLFFALDTNQGAEFAAFLPSKTFNISNLMGDIGNKDFQNALEIFDGLKFDDALLVISGSGFDLDLDDFDSDTFGDLDLSKFAIDGDNLRSPAGVSILANFDVGKSDFLSLAFDSVGFDEEVVTGRISVEWNVEQVVQAMIGAGVSVLPKLTMEIDLPSFKPTLFGELEINEKIDFTFSAALSADETSNSFGTSVTMAAALDFPVGGDDIETVLALTKDFSLDNSGVSTTTAISIGIDDEDGYENAFGWDFLTINNFAVDMAQTLSAGAPPEISNTLGLGGNVEIGTKTVIAYASMELGPVIMPDVISLEINDGPNKVGSIGFSDILSIFEEMVGQDIPEFPSMEFRGLEKGEGPSIFLSKDLIDVSGRMSLLGQDIVVIETGYFNAAEGIDIKGTAEKINLGPVEFPSGTFEAKLLFGANGIIGPNVNIAAEMDLFGVTADSLMTLTTEGYEVSSAFSLGSAFGIASSFGTTFPQGTNLSDLEDISASFSATMDSDISGWIDSSGKDAVKVIFNGLFNAIEASRKGVENAQDDVDDLTSLVSAASSEVSRISSNIQTCTQTFRQCIPVVRSSCQKKKWGTCIRWKVYTSCNYRTVADVPKRAACQAGNSPKYAAIAVKESEKRTLLISKEAATQTLKLAEAALAPIAKAESTIDDVISNLSAPNVFSIEEATISGELSAAAGGGELDASITYKVGNSKTKTAQIKFKMTDFAYTAEQMAKILADAFVEVIQEELDDPAVEFLIEQAKSTLGNL